MSRPANRPIALRSGDVMYASVLADARTAEEAANQKVGRPDIGGPFVLDALDGSRFTEKDLLGRFTMLYVRSIINRLL